MSRLKSLRTSPLSWAFFALFPLAGLLRLVADVALHPEVFQKDFEVYYRGPQLWLSGLNPFLTSGFVYQPILLPFFRLFSFVPEHTAMVFFVVAKLGVLIYLIYVWKRHFLKELDHPSFYLFCWLAFFGTIHLDFRAGNISVFESLLLWMGFAFFTQRKLAAFCALVVAAAVFKITPILFLGLCFLSRDKKRFRYFSVGFAAFLLTFLASYLWQPLFFSAFLTQALNRTGEGGIVNPSMLAFWGDVFQVVDQRIHGLPIILPKLAYAGTALGVAVASVCAFRKIDEKFPKDRERLFVFVAVLAYALVMPRQKDYAYVLLIPCAFFAIRRATAVSTFAALFLLTTLLSTQVPIPPWFNVFYGVFWNYYPLMVAAFVWWLLLTSVKTFDSCKENR